MEPPEVVQFSRSKRDNLFRTEEPHDHNEEGGKRKNKRAEWRGRIHDLDEKIRKIRVFPNQ